MDFNSLATKYVGDAATAYDARRAPSCKWRAEEDAARELLSLVPRGSRMLDVPIGTGRLLPHIKAHRFEAHGLDVSHDMLALAQARATATDTQVSLGLGDIRNIPFEDEHFDLVSCVRFLNLIDRAGVDEVVTELTRVTRDRLLLGIRYLPSFDALTRGPSPKVRLCMRALGATRLIAHRRCLYFHPRSFIEHLFERLGLEITMERHIEGRLDGTDYAFFLLRKRQSRPRVVEQRTRSSAVA